MTGLYAVFDGIATLTVLLPSTYLAILALLSGRSVATAPPKPGPAARLAVLVAAHNEERNLPQTIAAIRGAEGGDEIDIHIMADNCIDGTANVARAAGACVHERHEPGRRGKAAALNSLIDEVLGEDRSTHAFAVLDADARPEPQFFSALRSTVASGAQIVQAANLVDASTTAPLALMRQVAFHLRCELRPLAYTRLGASAGLYGNGMCFDRRVLGRYRWDERSVVEDHNAHLRLVADGFRVRFAPNAIVRSAMPGRFRGAGGQALRWEPGMLHRLVVGLRMILLGLFNRRIAWFVAGCEVAVPPLSFVVAASVLSVVLGMWLTDPGLAAIGAAALACCGVYVGRGIALARMGPRATIRFAVWAPAFIVWKLAILARAWTGVQHRWEQARPVPDSVGTSQTQVTTAEL